MLQCISSEVFVPCLIDLCKALWELMKSYHRTIDWHRRHDDAMATQAPANARPLAADAADGSSDGLSDLFSYIYSLHGSITQNYGFACRHPSNNMT